MHVLGSQNIFENILSGGKQFALYKIFGLVEKVFCPKNIFKILSATLKIFCVFKAQLNRGDIMLEPTYINMAQ